MLDRRLRVYVIGARAFGGEGGIENQIGILLPFLSKKFDVTVFVSKRHFFYGKREMGITQIPILAPRHKFIEKLWLSFIGSIFAFWYKPDIVHIQGLGAALWIPLIKLNRKSKVVVHIRSYDALYPEWNFLAKMVFSLINVIIRNFADYVIVVNELLRRFYASPSKKVVYIPDALSFGTKVDMSILKIFSLEPKKYFLCVGRITPIKQFEVAINACSSLQYPLVITGSIKDTKYYDYLVGLSSSNVIFTDHVPKEQLYALYKYARAFILPSKYEGMPNVVMEACYFRIPVYVSDIVPHRLLSFLRDEAFFSTPQELEEKLRHPQVGYDVDFYKEFSPSKIANKIAQIYFFLSSSSKSK